MPVAEIDGLNIHPTHVRPSTTLMWCSIFKEKFKKTDEFGSSCVILFSCHRRGKPKPRLYATRPSRCRLKWSQETSLGPGAT